MSNHQTSKKASRPTNKHQPTLCLSIAAIQSFAKNPPKTNNTKEQEKSKPYRTIKTLFPLHFHHPHYPHSSLIFPS